MSGRGGARVRRGIKVGVALLDAAMTAALAAGLAARHVRPDVVWWPQAVALAVPFLTVGVASAGVWWTLKAARPPRGQRVVWAAAVAHLGLASVGLARETGGLGLGGDGEPLTVLSLNVGQAPAEGPSRLRDLLGAVAPDVVAFQESALRIEPVAEAPEGRVVAAEPAVQPVLSNPSYTTAFPETPRRESLREPIFSRTQVVSLRHALLSEDDEAGVFSRAEIVWKGRRVAVYSLHLRSFGPARPWSGPGRFDVRRWILASDNIREDMVWRAQEAARFRLILEAERLPYLVLGDFNSTPHQWAYHHIAAGHADALAEVGAPFARTFPDGRPLVRIDGVLASRHWRILSARVGPEGLSDHRAVIAEVALAAGAAGERP